MNEQDQAIESAKKFLEDLLSFFGLNTDVAASHDDEVIELSVPSTHLNGFLIGQRGETLRALQALVSTKLKNAQAALTRVNIDVADYKQHRAERLREQLDGWVKKARQSGQPLHLQPMNGADRRTIHQALSDYQDVSGESEGEGRDRHLVLTFASAPEDSETES